MLKSGIDQDELIRQFSEATAKQGEALRKAVSDATLKALQSRELSLQNIKAVLKTITQAATAGIAKNSAPQVDIEQLITKALAGMDAALLKTVEANRKALQQFLAQGVGLQEKQLKEAVANLEKMEDVFFQTVTKAAQASGGQLQGPWDSVLSAMKMKGTQTGSQATQTVEQLMSQTQTALRDTRATGMRAAQAMMDSYSTLVSGVLIGMSEALQQQASAEPPDTATGGDSEGGAVTSSAGSGGARGASRKTTG